MIGSYLSRSFFLTFLILCGIIFTVMKVKNKCFNPYLKNINRIEAVVTYECTGNCRHCSQGDVRFRGVIDKDRVTDAMRKLFEIYDIESVMTFGGEPLIYPDDVCTILSCARDYNVPKRQVITNGYFSKDEKIIYRVAEKLAKSEVNDVLLSVDAFHQENIPTDPVMTFAKALKELKVPVRINPAWLLNKNYPCEFNDKTHGILNVFEKQGFYVCDGNIIFPKGNALKYLNEYFIGANIEDPYEEDPEDVRTVSFEPCGNVLNGNIYSSNIEDIISSYDPSDSRALRRIAEMESYMDDVISAEANGNIEDEKIKEKISILTKYMTCGEYLEDYERYENGKIPKNLKCGVLSQDALYDLLSEI